MEENIKTGDKVKWTIVKNMGMYHKTGFGTFVKHGNLSGFLVEVTKPCDGCFKRNDTIPTDYVNHHKIGRYVFVDKVERSLSKQGRKWGAKSNKDASKFSSIASDNKVRVFPTKAFVEYTSSTGFKKIEAITNLKTLPTKIQELVDKGAEKNSVKIYEVSSIRKVEFTSHVTVKVI